MDEWIKKMLFFHVHMIDHKASLVAQTVKNLPATQETQVQSLGLEDPLRKEWLPTWRSNQSILKGNQPEYSLEGLMLKLKLQYFGHLMGRAPSLEKILMLGKIESKRKRWWQTMRWLDNITHPMDMNLSKFQEIVKDRDTWHAIVHGGHKESDTTQQLNNNSVR